MTHLRFVSLCLIIVMMAAGAALAQAPSAEADPVIQPEPALTLTSSGDCPGFVTLQVDGATAGGLVAFAYGFQPGTTSVGICPDVVLQIARARLAGTAVANSSGTAQISGSVPAGACGNVLVQALDVRACVTSNVETIGATRIHPFSGNGFNPLTDYCTYTALDNCARLGIAIGDTICVACDRPGAKCPHPAKRVKFAIYDNPRCEGKPVCIMPAVGVSGTCTDCPTRHRFVRCP